MVQKPSNGGDMRDRPSPTWVVVATIGDTTWRMFLPVMVGALVGYWIDSSLHSLPLVTLVGTFVGCFLAILLVYRQYQGTKGNS
jgi:uncharacterized membrane protein YfcA